MNINLIYRFYFGIAKFDIIIGLLIWREKSRRCIVGGLLSRLLFACAATLKATQRRPIADK